MLAARAHQLADLGFHDLLHHGKSGSYGQRQQPVLDGAVKLAERDGHLRREVEGEFLGLGDDERATGYGCPERSPPFGLVAPFPTTQQGGVEDRSSISTTYRTTSEATGLLP